MSRHMEHSRPLDLLDRFFCRLFAGESFHLPTMLLQQRTNAFYLSLCCRKRRKFVVFTQLFGTETTA